MAEALKIHIWGGDGRARGYQASDSVLVNELADGVPLGDVWADVQDALAIYNQERSAIANLLGYRTVNAGEAVPQIVSDEFFEEATEYGVPRGIGDIGYLKLGYSFRDFDLGLRLTWKYLRDATSDQVETRLAKAVAADNKLVCGTVLHRLLSNINRTNEFGHTVYGLYNGDMQPPDHAGQKFLADHTHYLTTASTTLDAEDVENSLRHIRHHGYGTTQSARFLLFMNPVDVELSGITTWRAGVEYAAGKKPKFDFVVSSNAPARITSEHVEGAVPPAEYNNLPVTGSYGSALLIESYFIPQGWCTLVASGGPNSEANPVGLREHIKPQYQGLRLLRGHFQEYPLIDAYLLRGFGCGIRNRGAAVAMQITNSLTYTPPTEQQMGLKR